MATADSISAGVGGVRSSSSAGGSYNAPINFTEADGGLSTVLFDSIAGDTISGRIPHFLPSDALDSLRVEAFADSLSESSFPELPSGSHEGISGESLPPGYFNSTPLTALLTGTLLLAMLNGGMLHKAVKAYRSELWSVRRRPNMFDDEQKAPLPMAVILALVFTVFGGIVLYNIDGLPINPSFWGALTSMALLGCYYIFQQIVYRIVAYTFGNGDDCRRWLGGFAATQSFAGMGMIIPAFLLIFRPEWHSILIIISLAIYFAARIIFIIKGFRIFYRNLSSLLYFILYLCTLEILPALTVYRLASLISQS